MCECIVQHATSNDFLGLLAVGAAHGSSNDLSSLSQQPHPTAAFASRERKSVIKPNMQVSVIRQRDGELECVKVRWGWSPVWSMGTMPPRTHLPLHLVMRSRVFDRIRQDGRVLVAVDGWYDVSDHAGIPRQPSLSYTTSRQSQPVFLAAVAQISERPSGCDGLVLMTRDDSSGNHNRLLAFSAQDALRWLEPELQWEQAQHMALHMAVDEPQLEHILTSQRLFQARR